MSAGNDLMHDALTDRFGLPKKPGLVLETLRVDDYVLAVVTGDTTFGYVREYIALAYGLEYSQVEPGFDGEPTYADRNLLVCHCKVEEDNV